MIERRNPLWLPVVVGFLRKDHRVLLGQRPEGDSLAGCWEFPGGKIKEGEPPPVALARELQEELGVDVLQVGSLRMAITHSIHLVNVLILFYDILSWSGKPQPIYHEALQWADTGELHQLKIPEANKIHLDEIIKSLHLS